MKRFILSALLVTTAVIAYSQPNLACYKDTAMVEENIYKKDTVWTVKPIYQTGDWNLFYDYALTKLKSEYHYTDQGVKTGIWKEFYKGGVLRSEWDFTSPLVPLYPPGKEWFVNGKVKIERTQSADTVTETQYYANGRMSVYNKWDKKGMWVLHREWCEAGQLLIDYNPTVSQPAAVKKYHCNGNLKSEYNWYVFGFSGAYKEYHENGKISVEGQYTEKPVDQPVFMARKTGTWTYYDNKGKVTKTEKWENGKLVSTQK